MGRYGLCFKSMYNDFNRILKKIKNKKQALIEYAKVIDSQTRSNGTLNIHYRSRLDLFINDINGDLLHLYFIDQSLKDYLSFIEIPDKKNILELLQLYSTEPYYNILFDTEKYTVEYCVHFPEDNFGYAIKIAYEEETDDIIFHVIHENEEDFFSYLSHVKNSDVWPICKLAINILFYVQCFPDCVMDGLPKGTKLVNGFINPKKQITTSKSILPLIHNKEERAINPHFRMGHFRFLSSKRFTNKRGQVVFIHPTFVKGNSKYVLTEKNLEETFLLSK